MLRILAVLVVALGLALAAFFYWDALVPQSSQPAALRGSPSRLLDQRVPGFSLEGLLGPGFEARDLMTARRPVLVTFWGSWGPASILEHPVLMELRAAGVPLWGVAFRDNRTAALDYLERNGNPYARLAFDAGGRVALVWGVTEVPSTFLVDGDGIVRWHHAGPLTAPVVARQVMPLLERYAP